MSRSAGPGRLRHRVIQAIADHRLWSPGQRVVVAVSGGLDSTVLLDVLCETRGAHGAVISVATVDHGIRPGSAADADFVAGLAEARGLELHRADLDVGSTSEQALRDARYGYLDGLDVDRIALAHHRDDQAETLLLNLMRGAGSRGMAGMVWRHGRRVRPLLEEPRQALVDWAQHRGLDWREDPTNRDMRHLRNAVRAEVVPLIESLRPGATAALARSAGLAAEDEHWMNDLAQRAMASQPQELFTAWIAEEPLSLVGRVLRLRAPEMHRSHVIAVRRAAAAGSGVVALPGGRRWVVKAGRAQLQPIVAPLD